MPYEVAFAIRSQMKTQLKSQLMRIVVIGKKLRGCECGSKHTDRLQSYWNTQGYCDHLYSELDGITSEVQWMLRWYHLGSSSRGLNLGFPSSHRMCLLNRVSWQGPGEYEDDIGTFECVVCWCPRFWLTSLASAVAEVLRAAQCGCEVWKCKCTMFYMVWSEQDIHEENRRGRAWWLVLSME